MKTSRKIALILAAGCILLGVALMLVSRPKGGFQSLEFPQVKFETNTYPVSEPFEHICMQIISADVRFLPAEDHQCRVICHDQEDLTYTVRVSDGTLTISCTDERDKWYEHIGFFWGRNRETATVTVYLPAQEFGALALQTISGDVSIPEGFTFDEAQLVTTSGDIDFAGAVSDRLQVHSTSGDIALSHMSCSAVEIVTTSSDVEVSNLTAGTLTLRTTSGELTLSAVQVRDLAALETISGDIDFDRTDAGNLRIQTVSGDVRGSLLSPKNVITHTTSGSVHVPAPNTSAVVCEISTTSGDIWITAPDEAAYTPQRAKDQLT